MSRLQGRICSIFWGSRNPALPNLREGICQSISIAKAFSIHVQKTFPEKYTYIQANSWAYDLHMLVYPCTAFFGWGVYANDKIIQLHLTENCRVNLSLFKLFSGIVGLTIPSLIVLRNKALQVPRGQLATNLIRVFWSWVGDDTVKNSAKWIKRFQNNIFS